MRRAQVVWNNALASGAYIPGAFSYLEVGMAWHNSIDPMAAVGGDAAS